MEQFAKASCFAFIEVSEKNINGRAAAKNDDSPCEPICNAVCPFWSPAIFSNKYCCDLSLLLYIYTIDLLISTLHYPLSSVWAPCTLRTHTVLGIMWEWKKTQSRPAAICRQPYTIHGNNCVRKLLSVDVFAAFIVSKRMHASTELESSTRYLSKVNRERRRRN